MLGRTRSGCLVLLLLLCFLTRPAGAQVGQVPYESQSIPESKTLEGLLDEKAWHFRCFGLFRLERYSGDEVAAAITEALSDKQWQVRCFALRAAVRHGVEVDPELFKLEKEPRVIRMAQRIGVPIPEATLHRVASAQMKSSTPERIVLGIELGVRSGDKKLIGLAKKRLGDLLTNMNTAVLVTVGDRLSELLGTPPFKTVREWQSYIENNAHNLKFPEFNPENEKIKGQPLAPIAQLDEKAFLSLVDYLDNLHQQDLELVVAIDGTGSMGGVITQAQSQTNRLMLTLNELARSMEMGVIIFRTHTDRPMLERQTITSSITKLRTFLFKVEAKGGGPEPEAIVETLQAMNGMGFSKAGVKQIVLIADEPPQPQTLGDIKEEASRLSEYGVTVNTAVAGNHPETTRLLKDVADWGGGKSVNLSAAQDLTKLVARLLIDEKMHESFDHLYELYTELGM